MFISYHIPQFQLSKRELFTHTHTQTKGSRQEGEKEMETNIKITEKEEISKLKQTNWKLGRLIIESICKNQKDNYENPEWKWSKRKWSI